MYKDDDETTIEREVDTEERDVITSRLTKPKKRVLTEEGRAIKTEQCRLMREKKKIKDDKLRKLREEADDETIQNLANITKLDKMRIENNQGLIDEMTALRQELQSLKEQNKPKPKKVRPPSPPPSTTEPEFLTASDDETETQTETQTETEPEPPKPKKRRAPAKRKPRKPVETETESEVSLVRPKTARKKRETKPIEENTIPTPPKKILLFR
tara:strand:+ start:18 stop:656 length:639 start_codon:yes stop_codon:yes gene_type:complete